MTRRTTVTFDDRDQGVIASVSNPNRAEWAALVEAAAEKDMILKPGASEAAIIRALVHVGADAIRDRALERGYAELAALWPDVHDAAEAHDRRCTPHRPCPAVSSDRTVHSRSQCVSSAVRP